MARAARSTSPRRRRKDAEETAPTESAGGDIGEVMPITDAEKLEQADDLARLFKAWEDARALAVAERKRCGDNVKAKLASLKEGMEVGHQNDAQRLLKLTVVEDRWQELEEARTERKEIFGQMKDAVTLCEQKIRDAIAKYNSNQLGLGFTAEQMAPKEDGNPNPDADGDGLDDDDDT